MGADQEYPSLRNCPRCGGELSPGAVDCPRCGVVFAKLHRLSKFRHRNRRQGLSAPVRLLLDRALTLPPQAGVGRIVAQGLIWLVLLLLGWSFITAGIDATQISPSLPHHLLSNVNLVFHEAGHVLFRPLGRFMTILGGSLLQVLVPALCTVAFLTRHLDTFGASVTLWWAGQSLIDLAPYINDARAQQLILLGGVTGRDRPGYHDWNNLLTSLGWLDHDHTVAALCHGAGGLLIGLALVWGLYLILGQVKQMGSQG